MNERTMDRRGFLRRLASAAASVAALGPLSLARLRVEEEDTVSVVHFYTPDDGTGKPLHIIDVLGQAMDACRYEAVDRSERETWTPPEYGGHHVPGEGWSW